MGRLREWTMGKIRERTANLTEEVTGLPAYPNCKLTSRIVDFNAELVTISFWMSGTHIGRLTFRTDNFMNELAAFTNLFTEDPWEAVGDREEVERQLAEYGYPVTSPTGIPKIGDNPNNKG